MAPDFLDLDAVDRELSAMGAPQVYKGPSHVHAQSVAPRAAQAPRGAPPSAPRGAPPGWQPRPVPPPPSHRQEGPPQFGGSAYPQHIQEALDENQDPAARAAFERAQGRQQQPMRGGGGGAFGDAAHVDSTVLQPSRPTSLVDPEFQQPYMGPAPGFQPPPVPLAGPPPGAADRRGNVRPLSTEPLPVGAPLTLSQAEMVAQVMERQAEMHILMAEQFRAVAAVLRQKPPVDDDAPTVTETPEASVVPPPPTPPEASHA